MKNEISKKVNMYRAINDMAIKGEIVIFGSTFAANFPFYEMSQDYVMSNAIYNRSIPELTLRDALDVVQSCVIDLKPEKVFLCFGDCENDFSTALTEYRKLIYKLKEKLPYCKIYVLSVKDTVFGATDFNQKLTQLAERENVKFLQVHYSANDDLSQYKKVFKELSCFFRNAAIDFSGAFMMASK